MEAVTNFIKKFRRRPGDVVGIDMGSTSVKAVRMRKGVAGPHTVVAACVIPLPPKDEAGTGEESARLFPDSVSLPPKLRARYASIAVPGKNSVIKLLSFPGRFDESAEGRVVDNLGIQDPASYRVAYRLLREGHARTEARVLAVALPESEAAEAMGLFADGIPAPFSLEVSGLATLTAFANGPLRKVGDDAVGVIDFGASSTFVAFFNKGTTALVRQFSIGADDVVRRVQRSMGVDADTARGIIADGAFDISQPVLEVFAPLIKQLAVSRDFVERREDCRVSTVFASGGVVASRDVQQELTSSIEVALDFWNPLDGLTIANGAIPTELEGQEWRLSAAVGACLATFEEE